MGNNIPCCFKNGDCYIYQDKMVYDEETEALNRFMLNPNSKKIIQIQSLWRGYWFRKYLWYKTLSMLTSNTNDRISKSKNKKSKSKIILLNQQEKGQNLDQEKDIKIGKIFNNLITLQ